MRVYTTTKVLKDAWTLLKELELNSLLDGIQGDILKIRFNPIDFLDKLIEGNKLDEFCAIITKKEEKDFEDIEFPEKEALIKDFFSVIGNPLKPLLIFVREKLNKMMDLPKQLEELSKKLR